MEALGRTVYIVIFPDKCIPRTFASKCMPMFLSWFWQKIKTDTFFGVLSLSKEKESYFLADTHCCKPFRYIFDMDFWTKKRIINIVS